jgi:hypothetical protein
MRRRVKARFISEERNALDYLAKAYEHILRTDEDPINWKWVVIGLHGALLKDLLRNNFEHFVPKLWSIELHGLPDIAIDVLDVIRFLALDTGNYTHLRQSQIRKVRCLVFRGKKALRSSGLYRELSQAEKGGR